MKHLLYLCLFLFSKEALAQATISNGNLSYYNLSCDQVAVPLTAVLCGFNSGDIITGTLNFGDGSSSTINPYTVNNGANSCDSNYYVVTNHTYATPGTYILTATLNGPSASSNTTSFSIYSSNCYDFSGSVFNDLNNNCVKDLGEMDYANIPVELYVNNGLYSTTYTSSNGSFQFNNTANMPNGYSIKLGNTNGGTVTCPANLVYNPTGIVANNLNFGLNISPSLSILSVSSNSNGANCGDSVDVSSTIQLCNLPAGNIQVDINYGDGNTSTTLNSYNPWNPSSCENAYITTPFHTYATPGTYNITLIATMNGYSDTMITSATASSCSHYSGYLFDDANLNCIKDAGELPMPFENINLNTSINSYGAYTDINGYYEFFISNPSGGQIAITPMNQSLLSCPTQGTYTTTASSGSNINFGFTQPVQPPMLITYLNNAGISCGTTVLNLYLDVTQCVNTGNVSVTVDFGDGSPLVNYNNLNLSGGSGCNYWYLPSGTTHNYPAFGNYTVTAYTTDGTLSDTTSQVVSFGQCSNFNGAIFTDLNNNCINDLGEQLPSQEVYIEDINGNFVAGAITDINGNYQTQIQWTNGMTYKVYPSTLPSTSGCYNVTCPSSLFYLINSPLTSNLDFGVTNTNANFDNTISGINIGCCNVFQAGANRTFRVNYANLLCGDNSGEISLTMEPNMVFNWAYPSPTSINGNVITWNYSNLNNIYWNHFVDVNVYVPFLNSQGIAYVTGDPVCFTANINATSGTDVDLTNNTTTQCIDIGTAFDPNDKHSMPQGEGPTGLIAKGTDIEYMIRFQNTGAAPAQQVYILDTLDSDLDETSVKVLGNSHNVVLTQTGNILRLDFPNILLPDSATNVDASQGFVRYKVKQKTNIQYGATIKNTAHIHFDAQAAVVTNTTLHTIQSPSGIKELSASNNISVYPNPTQNTLNIKHLNGGKIARVEVLNTIGAMVMQKEVSGNEVTLMVKDLVSGIYWLSIIDTNGNKTMKSFTKE